MCSPQIMEKVRSEISRRRALGIAGAAAIAGIASRIAPAGAQQATPVATPGALGIALGSYTRVYDLTHTITPTIPVFPGNPQPLIEPLRTFENDGYYANKLTYAEHTGTHMDAPAHIVEGATTAEDLPVERFFAPLAVVDVSARAATDPDTQVMPDDILAWEATHGPLPPGAFVAMYSGWESRLVDPETFINMDDEGVLHFPGFHPDATTLLVEDRDITGIGVDTLSLDYGAAKQFTSHVILLETGRYGLEGLASLASVPPAGALLIVGGPKVMIASGGPSRVLALA